MNMFDIYPTRFISPHDLKGKPHRLKIRQVVIEKVFDFKKQEEVDKPILYFEVAKKGIVLKKIINKILTKAFGPETDLWKGCEITLYPVRIKAFGEEHDVVRARIDTPEPEHAV